MIIDRYLIREICKPLVAVCAVMVVILASYRAAQYLAEAVAGVSSGQIVLYLVLLKILVALEVLLPTTLFLSVVIALGRLYTDFEMTALFACGVGISRVLRAVIYVSVPLALVVACLSLYVRPWAYQKGHWLKAQAKTSLDISKWKEDSFYKIRGMDRIIYADEIHQGEDRAEGVFIQSAHGDKVQVIYAKQVYQQADNKTGKKVLLFLDGYLYEFSRTENEGHIMKFQQSTLALEPEGIALDYKRKAASTRKLAYSVRPEDVAEFQWRLSTPLSTLLLALLGIPLSRTAPRRGKYGRVAVAVLIFALYYNTSAMAKNWVEQGVVGSMPGLWWVVALLGTLVLVLFIQPNLSFRWQHRYRRSSG